MNTNPREVPTMYDRADIEAVIFNTAFAALDYSPEKVTGEDGYTIDEDIQWCIAPLAGKPGVATETLATRVREVILDPTTHRHAFVTALRALIA